ncbi:helix-turn-helix DNA binding domain [Arthrobacter phage Bumble]|uniref:Helix-turn-helix DNA binding domain protein n=1 Tax=Arthrobacter phage Bumble TaxID=2743904 RepID=A0A7G3V9R5_9CAUD|nr:helix-turn-helix DNA binding domain protein [Arthrobacter phage Bumble]
MTLPNADEIADGPAGEPEDFAPDETTDSYFVMIPLWVLDSASGEAIKLLGILSTYLNSNSRIVWPSRQTLAERLGKSRAESVDRYLQELSDLGALKIIKRYRPDGGQTSNAYRIVRNPPPSKPRTPPLKSAEAPPLKTAHELRSSFNLEERDLRSAPVSKVEAPVHTPSTTVENVTPALFGEDEVSAAIAKIEADPFAEFWRIYPRKDDKKRAERAWAKALLEADAGEILAGALRYRTDPNREAQYTKQPATWLNAGAWANDPLPPRSGARPTLDDKLAGTAALTGNMVEAWARTFGGSRPSGQLAIDSSRN